MADADVVVAPSVPSSDGRREGIPVVLMEAMAMRRPVVASRLSGIPELVEDGRSGLLVPPGDADAVAEALLRLARDARLRRELGLAGRRRVEAAFSLEGEVDRLLALVGTFHGDAQLLAASRRAAASTPDGRTDSSHSS